MLSKQSSRKYGRQKTQSSRLSAGHLRESGGLNQSVTTQVEDQAKAKPALYKNFFFWIIILVILFLAPWLYMFLHNEGCPEYTIIEMLQLE